jgi:hypothetical protein
MAGDGTQSATMRATGSRDEVEHAPGGPGAVAPPQPG